LKLEHDNECLLLLKDIQFEDHTIQEDGWVCEFPHPRAVSELNGREFMDIDVPKEVIDELHPTSGASVLITRGAYIEESLDTKEMKLHIPDDAKMTVKTLQESDPRHYQQRRRARRRSADSNPGELSVLVIRVVDSEGAKLAATDAQLVDDVFTDEFSLKTGYEQCSKDQLIMEPATGSGISNGIYTVNIGIPASDGSGAIQQEAFAQATAELGSLSSQWDLVMFCQPPGSGDWLAYAFINSWASFYNDYWCQRVSAQMHEVGHNLGLGHSNQGSQSYGDQSSMMGFSYNSDDGPKMCFNAAKNFQLGWYELQKESFYPLQNKNDAVDFVLNGVDEYKKDGSATDGELITLRIVEYGDTYDPDTQNYGKDYYIGYNRATGPNTGTLEGTNQVLVFEKDDGGPNEYGESNRVADLNVGDTYTIPNFQNKNFDVTIRWKSIANDGRDATVEITTVGDEVPTEAPTPSCGGIGRFRFELQTDRYAYETGWQLIDNESNKVVEDVTGDNYISNKQYLYPRDEDGTDYYCLDEGRCYTVKVTDSWGDGLYDGEGNYVGYLDDEIEFVGDGDFAY